MAAESYTSKVIVLRKTKLGESDLILNLLAQDGSQLRVVAKGARKPSNTFAARLDLYSIAEVFCSKGRNLDIVKEVKLIHANERLRSDIGYAVGAAPMVELLDKVAQRGLADPRLFDMTSSAFLSLQKVEPEGIPSLSAAHLLKTFAFAGLKPSFTTCVNCGSEVPLESSASMVRLSYGEGGILCENCGQGTNSILVQTEMCKWARVLLTSTFAQIEAYNLDPRSAFTVLEFCQAWTRAHVGTSLKSLDFMFTSKLFT